MKKIFFAMAALVASMTAVTSCSSDEVNNGVSGQKGNTISLTSTFQTRATSDPQTTQLSTNVTVGAFGVANDATITNGDNNQYAVETTGTLTATNDMTWPLEGSVNIYAYAPYQAGWAYNDDNDFAVATDQTTEAGYLASDLVYGVPVSNPVAQTEDAIALGFTHKLAKINITIQKAEGSTIDLTAASVTIINTKVATTLNPSTGTLGEATGDAADIKAVTALGEATTACAIIVPQQLDANTQLVKIVAGDKTLIAKVGTATSFVGGKSYNFTVNVGSTPTPVTEVTLKLGSTAVVDWGSEDMGAATGEEQVEYGIGDYVLTDGTFIKAADYAANSANVAAIIFSTTVSETDATAGYNAYAMALKRYRDRMFPDLDAYKTQVLTSAVTTYSAGYNDLDGRTKTATILAHDYYSALTDDQKTSFFANFSAFTPAFADAAASTVSGWFVPSFGQMVQILNQFGEAGITSTLVEDNISSGSPFYTSENDALTTLINNLNAKVSSMFAVGNVVFATSTENGGSGHVNKFWFVQTEDTNKTWSLGKGQQRGTTGRNVIPVVAVKLPTE